MRMRLWRLKAKEDLLILLSKPIGRCVAGVVRSNASGGLGVKP